MTDCKLCGKIFSSKQMLDYHMYKKIIPCTLKCQKCGEKFNDPRKWTYHTRKEKSCNIGPFIEIPYEKKYDNQVDINNVHVSKKDKVCLEDGDINHDVDEEGNTTYNCDYCNKTYSTKSNLNRHLNKYCFNKIKIEKERLVRRSDAEKNRIENDGVININKGTINKGTINNDNSSTNNTYINIITLPGEESRAHFTEEMMKDITEDNIGTGFIKFMEYLFFDKNGKQNHKWYISDYNRKNGGVEYDHENNIERKVHSHSLVDKYVQIGLDDRINDLMDRETLSPRETWLLNLLLSRYSNEDWHKTLVQEALLMGYNSRSIPRETIREYIKKRRREGLDTVRETECKEDVFQDTGEDSGFEDKIYPELEDCSNIDPDNLPLPYPSNFSCARPDYNEIRICEE